MLEITRRWLVATAFLGHLLPASAQQLSVGSLLPYDARALFAPDFLAQPPATRTAGGAPSARYWQNTADYRIAAILDEKATRLVATVTITYTNNSPDELPFVWLQLD